MPKISVLSPSIRPEGLAITQKCLSEQTFTDFEWLVEIGIPGNGHDLNKSYNRMLRRAKGELIVSLQDYIKILPTGLENFWKAYQENKRVFYTAPVGKTDDKTYSAKSNKWDWRAFTTEIMNWQKWEIDWGAAPLSALKEIGGFDETLDDYWSFDNVNVGFRADMAGYKFGNLINNLALAYDHDAFIKHPFRERFNPEYHNERLDEFRHGLRLDYLS